MNTKNLIIPADYKDWIYRATYFLLGKVAHRVPAKIEPNQITLMAFFSALLGTSLLYFMQSPIAYLYWMIFNLVWYVLDALDGIHARLTGKTSEFGAFLDHALDNLYFLAMFAVFVVKFDLHSSFYILIIMMRLTAAIMVFTVQCHTDRLYLSRLSGGVELLLFSLAMLFSYAWPDLNLALHTTNITALWWIDALDLRDGVFMKLALLPYFIGVPITMYFQFKFVREQLA